LTKVTVLVCLSVASEGRQALNRTNKDKNEVFYLSNTKDQNDRFSLNRN